MTRLILIDGLPGAGKSTLAKCYARDNPLHQSYDPSPFSRTPPRVTA